MKKMLSLSLLIFLASGQFSLADEGDDNRFAVQSVYGHFGYYGLLSWFKYPAKKRAITQLVDVLDAQLSGLEEGGREFLTPDVYGSLTNLSESWKPQGYVGPALFNPILMLGIFVEPSLANLSRFVSIPVLNTWFIIHGLFVRPTYYTSTGYNAAANILTELKERGHKLPFFDKENAHGNVFVLRLLLLGYRASEVEGLEAIKLATLEKIKSLNDMIIAENDSAKKEILESLQGYFVALAEAIDKGEMSDYPKSFVYRDYHWSDLNGAMSEIIRPAAALNHCESGLASAN